MNSGVLRGGMGLRGPFRPGATELAGGCSDLVAALFMRRDKALLAAVLAEEAGRLDAALEAAVQFFERFARACLDVHANPAPEQHVFDIVPEASLARHYQRCHGSQNA
jgi:hypothetical protein